MVSVATILSAFSGVVGVVIGAVGSYVVMRDRQKRITERRRATTYFDNQAETLLKLYSELRSCFEVLNEYANQASNGTVTQREFEEVKTKMTSFENTLRQSELFLTDDEYTEIEAVLPVFARTELYLHWKVHHPSSSNPPAGKEMNWEEFGRTHKQVRNTLRDIIRDRYAEPVEN